MRPPQLRGQGADLDAGLEERVVAVPLDEVGPRAAAERAVGVGLADAVATRAAAMACRPALQGDERVGRPLARAGVVLLAEGGLFGRQALLAVDGGPRRGRRAGCAGIAGRRARGSR